MPADKSAHRELHDTSHEGACENQHAEQHRDLSMHENPRRDRYCERERDQPKVERQVGNRGEPAQQSGGDATDEEGHQQGTDEQGKHLADNHPKGKPEAQPASRVYEGHEGRDEDCAGEVDQQGISRQRTHVAAQFGSHHSRSRRGRAEETEHHALHEDSARGLLHHLMQQAEQGSEAGLESQQPPLPAAKSHVAELNAAKRQRQHQEDQRGLDVGDALHDALSDRLREPQALAEKVGRGTNSHAQRQRPILKPFAI